MKHETTKKKVWTAVAAVMLAAPLTFGAKPQKPEQGRRGFRGEHGGGHPGALMRELDLSKEQREQIRALFEQGTGRETFERLRTSREALNEAIENGADEGTLRQLAYDVGTAEGDAAFERARMQAQMMEILTPEQQEKWKALKAERKEKREERRKRFEERRRRHPRREPEGSQAEARFVRGGIRALAGAD